MTEQQTPIPPSEPSDGVLSGLTTYIAILARWRTPIYLTTFIVGACTAAYLWYFVPNVYESKASIKSSIVSQINTSGLGSMLNVKGIGDIGGMLGIAGQRNDLDQYIAVLESESVLSEIVRRYHFQQEFHAKYFEDAVKAFSGNIKTASIREAQLLTIAVRDTNPQRAQRLCRDLIELLDSVNKSLSRRNAQSAREYLELRYAQCVRELESAEDSLRIFQMRYKVYDMKDQATASIKVAAELEGQIIMKQVQANMLSSSLGVDDADARRLNNEVDELKRQRRQMDNGMDLKSAFQSIIPFADAPQLGMEYIRRFRDEEIQQRLFTMLLPLLEQARVDEQRNTPTLLVLDEPTFPQRKVGPLRTILTLAVMFITFVFAFMIAVLLQKTQQFSNTQPEKHRAMKAALRKIAPAFLFKWL